MQILRRLARHSATHFLLLGALAFALVLNWPEAPAAAQAVAINRAEIDALRTRESERLGRPVQDAEFKRSLDAYVDDRILLERAFDLGLDRNNPAVENRLLRLLEFLDEDIGGTDVQKLMHARRLGLDRSDPMVCRVLIEAVRFLVSKPKPADFPGDAEIAEYYRQHAQSFDSEARWNLTQVFFGHARQGGDARRNAERLIEDFRRGRLDEAALMAAGDAFQEGNRMGPLTRAGIGTRFGEDFSAGFAGLPAGSWQGPLPSPYGWHLVKAVPAGARRPAPLQQVHNRIVHELMRQRGEARLRQRMTELRRIYTVSLEPAP